MKKYKVRVNRTSVCAKEIIVEALTPEDAKGNAIDKSYNLVFDNEYESDYEVMYCNELINEKEE